MRIPLLVILLFIAPWVWSVPFTDPEDALVVPRTESPAVVPPRPVPEPPMPPRVLAEKAERENKEKEHRSAVEKASVAYAECLNSEKSSLFGADFQNCNGARNRLKALYSTQMADAALGCLEVAVLKKSLAGATRCTLTPIANPDTSNEGRWK